MGQVVTWRKPMAQVSHNKSGATRVIESTACRDEAEKLDGSWVVDGRGVVVVSPAARD